MTDGTLTFDTKIDDNGLKKGAVSLKKQAQKIVSSINSIGKKTNETFSNSKAIQKTEIALNDAKKRMNELAKRTDNYSTSSVNAFEKQKVKLQEYIKQLDEIDNKREKMAYDEEKSMEGLPYSKNEAGAQIEKRLSGNKEYQKLTNQASKLEDKIRQAAAEQERLKVAMERTAGTGSKEYAKAVNEVNKFSLKLKQLKAIGTITNPIKTGFQKLNEKVIQTGKSIKQHITDKIKSARKPADSLAKSIFRLSNMFKLMALRMMLRGALEGIKTGFNNLVQYSSGVNASASAVKSSLTQLKNSLATAFAPILNTVVPILQTLINYLIAAATAIAQFFAAFTGQKTVVKATKVQENYAGALGGTGGAAKEASKSLADFDTIVQLNNNASSGNGGGGGAGGVSPADMFETVEVDSKFVEFADKLKTLLKPTIEALGRLKQALEPLKTFAFQGLIDFYSLFLKPVGTWIFGEGLPRMIDALANGLMLVNWETINSGLARLWEALAPFAINVGSGLVWLWENALVPLGTWTLNNAVPLFLDGLSTVLDILNSVIEVIKPGVLWLWDNLLLPVAQWTGSTVISALRTIIDTIAELVNKLTEGWQKHISPVLKNFGDKFMEIANKYVGPAIENIKEIISILWNEVLKPVVLWFIEQAYPKIADTISKIGNVFNTLFETVSEVVLSITEVLKGIIEFVVGVFKNDWDMAWEGVKSIFKGVFNGIISIAESAINFIVRALNKISFDVPDWVPIIGGEHFGFNISEVKLPRLATGTVIPPNTGEFAAILGDNKTQTEIVSPIPAMKQAFLEAIAESNVGNGNVNITFKGNLSQLARILKPEIERETRRIGNSLVEGGMY